jgi:hypothetical protein
MLVKRVISLLIITLCLGFKSDPNFLNIEGLVTVDGKPVTAEIEINKVHKHNFTANPSEKIDGSFKTKLPRGEEYEIIVKVDRFPQQVIRLETGAPDAEGDLNVYADFISPEYDKRLDELFKSSENYFNKNSLRNKKEFVSVFGNATKDQLEYKIQIAAFKFFENFNYNNVSGFPKIIRKTGEDQITRFTMGSFDTYLEANQLLEKLKENNLEDAFIIAVYKGERKTLQQLVDEKILF